MLRVVYSECSLSVAMLNAVILSVAALSGDRYLVENGERVREGGERKCVQ